MSSGERPIGAAQGKQSDTEALCQTHPAPLPLPVSTGALWHDPFGGCSRPDGRVRRFTFGTFAKGERGGEHHTLQPMAGRVVATPVPTAPPLTPRDKHSTGTGGTRNTPEHCPKPLRGRSSESKAWQCSLPHAWPCVWGWRTVPQT